MAVTRVKGIQNHYFIKNNTNYSKQLLSIKKRPLGLITFWEVQMCRATFNIIQNYKTGPETTINPLSVSKDLLKVFPNPSQGSFNLQLIDNRKITDVEIYDLLGKRILFLFLIRKRQRNHAPVVTIITPKEIVYALPELFKNTSARFRELH